MELLAQKGADLLSDGSVPTRAQRGLVAAERVVTACAVTVVLLSIYLVFRELPMIGLTWDEWMDFEIARDFHRNRAFLTNQQDPSQARFSHVVAAGSFALFGESYLSFKLPFALIGLSAGLWLWWFLAHLVRPTVAASVAAMYFSCPYVLAASRTGATAGDVLVLATTVGFVITLYHWIQTGRFWPHGAGCGVMCGLSIGSKWTGALLLGSVVLAWGLHLMRQKRRIFDGNVWVSVLAQQWIAVGLGVLASPTLLLGWPFIKSSLDHSLMFTGMALLQFGEVRAAVPWYYIPAVLVSKLSPLQLLVFVYELGLTAVWWAVRRRRVEQLPTLALLSLLPIIPLAAKGFQNAHYYLATVPAVMILSALTMDRWLRTCHIIARWAVLMLATVTMIGQLALSVYLAPDYLLAGRQFGKFFYSQFAGPAVNHCQGLPYAIQEINDLVVGQEGGPQVAYLYRSCIGVMNHAIADGPVKPRVPITAAPPTGITTDHYLIVPGCFDYDILGRSAAATVMRDKNAMLANCTPAGKGHPDYDLYLCPGLRL